MDLLIFLTLFDNYRRMFCMQEFVQLVLLRSSSGEHAELTTFVLKMMQRHSITFPNLFFSSWAVQQILLWQFVILICSYDLVFLFFFFFLWGGGRSCIFIFTLWYTEWTNFVSNVFAILTALLEKIREVVKSIDSLMLVVREMRGENGSIFLKELQL